MLLREPSVRNRLDVIRDGSVTRGSEWAMGCRDLREEARSRSSRVLPSDERTGHAHLAAWRVRRDARVQIASRAVFRQRFQQPVRGSHGPDRDLRTACREGAFGADAARPFPGWLMLVEECEASAVPVRVAGPHFRVDPVFRGASRIERHDIPCKRLAREGLYTGTALMASPREAVDDGRHGKMSGTASLRTLVTGFAGHIAAAAARRAAWRETGNMTKACGSRIRPCRKASSREWGQTGLPSKLLPRRLRARRLPSWPHMQPGIGSFFRTSPRVPDCRASAPPEASSASGSRPQGSSASRRPIPACRHTWNAACERPHRLWRACGRGRLPAVRPWCSLGIPMICSSGNRHRFIRLSPASGNRLTSNPGTCRGAGPAHPLSACIIASSI